MMPTRLWILAVFASLSATAVALPQSGDRSWLKLFGGAPKSGTGKATQDDGRRMTEIRVELAWLADSTTFPYFLEAKVEGSALSVRGFVPNKNVRAQAMR